MVLWLWCVEPECKITKSCAMFFVAFDIKRIDI